MKETFKNNIPVTLISVLIILTIIALWIINIFYGNPLSENGARKNITAYLEDERSGIDFTVSELKYNKNDMTYYAYVTESHSQDLHFYVGYGADGIKDSYENTVSNGYNTYLRLNSEFSAAAERAFNNNTYKSTFFTAGLGRNIHDYTTLMLDEKLDTARPPMESFAIIYINQDDVSWDVLATLALEIDNMFLEEKIKIDRYDILLTQRGNSSVNLEIYDFKREDLDRNDLSKFMESK